MKAQTKGLYERVNVVRSQSLSNKGFQKKCDSKNPKQRASFTKTFLLSANFKSGLLTKGQCCQNANIALKGQVGL